MFEHHGGTSFLLKEGNQTGRLLDDDTWATHNFNTFFRNYNNCSDPDFPISSPYAIGIDAWARFENIVGNAWGGGSGCGSSYGSIVRVNNGAGNDATGLTTASLMNWGNYVACSGDSRCNTAGSSIFASSGVPSNLASFGANSTPYQNPVPSSATLPASFFMNSMTAHPSGGTGLSWWKACASWSSFPTSCGSTSTPPMPPIGPDVTGGPHLSGHAYDIPAAVAWASLPLDNNYSTPWGHVKQFDERVYQSDGVGGAPPPPPGNVDPPTGLSATVS